MITSGIWMTFDFFFFFFFTERSICHQQKAWKVDYLKLRSQVSVTGPLVLWFIRGIKVETRFNSDDEVIY